MPLSRAVAVCVLTVGMLATGLGGPAAGAELEVIPETVTDRLDGLPALQEGLSRPVETEIPFSMVGFEVPTGTEIEFRTSDDGTQWTPWTEADGASADEGPDAQSQEARRAGDVLTEPVWVGDASHIQTRASRDGEAVDPQQVGIELIDSAGLGRSWGRRVLDRLEAAWHGTPPPAAALAGRPAIVTRKQWGADESLRRGSPVYAERITLGIVHHTAGSNQYSAAEAPAVMRGVYRYHTQSRGWSDIGYNFLIDRYGTVYEGRYGGITRPVIGAHSGGFNTGTFGVSLIGSFESTTPPPAMQASLEQLLAWKYDLHYVDVLGKTTYTSYGSTKYPAGRRVTLHRLSGHQDVSTTACPGSVYATLPDLRVRVAQSQGPVFLEHGVQPAAARVVNGSSLDGPFTFQTRLRPAGPWTLDVISPSGAVVHTVAGTGATASAQWTPGAAEPGEYRYRFSGVERRHATGTIKLVPPAISASASPPNVRVTPTGTLAQPVTFSAALYRGARWNLRVTDPSGAVAHTASGTGQTAETTWNGPALRGPGIYTWTLAADDVPPVSGTIELFLDRVSRVGAAQQAAGAAAEISRQSFLDLEAQRVVLTRGDLQSFAFPAGPLAGRRGPVLYTEADSVPAQTAAEIRRVLQPGGTIFVMGGNRIISDTALASLQGLWTIQRVGDNSPVRTAAAAAEIVLAEQGEGRALLVNAGAEAWRQSLAASGYGAAQGIPVLLTHRDTLPRATRGVISGNVLTSVTVIGNTTAVSDTVRAALPGGARISGSTAPATAAAVSVRLFGRTAPVSGDAFVFANADRSDGWVRALAAAPRTARATAPLLVAARNRVPKATKRYLERVAYSPSRAGSGWALGGPGHIAEATRDALSRHLQ